MHAFQSLESYAFHCKGASCDEWDRIKVLKFCPFLSFSGFYSTEFTTSVTCYLIPHTMDVYATEIFQVSGLEWCLETQPEKSDPLSP